MLCMARWSVVHGPAVLCFCSPLWNSSKLSVSRKRKRDAEWRQTPDPSGPSLSFRSPENKVTFFSLLFSPIPFAHRYLFNTCADAGEIDQIIRPESFSFYWHTDEHLVSLKNKASRRIKYCLPKGILCLCIVLFIVSLLCHNFITKLLPAIKQNFHLFLCFAWNMAMRIEH